MGLAIGVTDYSPRGTVAFWCDKSVDDEKGTMLAIQEG